MSSLQNPSLVRVRYKDRDTSTFRSNLDKIIDYSRSIGEFGAEITRTPTLLADNMNTISSLLKLLNEHHKNAVKALNQSGNSQIQS
jgi:hypothetical protein